MDKQRVRIGVAKRVHYVDQIESQAYSNQEGLYWYWATSKCGKWAGEANLTKDRVTCKDCMDGK